MSQKCFPKKLELSKKYQLKEFLCSLRRIVNLHVMKELYQQSTTSEPVAHALDEPLQLKSVSSYSKSLSDIDQKGYVLESDMDGLLTFPVFVRRRATIC